MLMFSFNCGYGGAAGGEDSDVERVWRRDSE